jgi:hypothetical protein
LEPLEGLDKGTQSFKAVKTATIGLASLLPLPLEMVMEIELVEDKDFTDQDLLETGVELDLSWGRLRSRHLESESFWKEFHSINDHFLLKDLKTYLAAGSAQSPGWYPQEIDAVTLGGKEEGAAGPMKTTVPLGDIEPCNLYTLCKYPLPRGLWSPGQTEMGGITREDEQNSEIFQPVAVSKTDQMQNLRASAAFLRIIPRVKGEAKPTQASAPPGTGPASQEQQP